MTEGSKMSELLLRIYRTRNRHVRAYACMHVCVCDMERTKERDAERLMNCDSVRESRLTYKKIEIKLQRAQCKTRKLHERNYR